MKWLIDGHNLIGQLPNLRLDDPHDELKLLELLRRYRARTGHGLTVIFDPGQSYRPSATRKQGGITVQFAPFGKTADQVIMQRIRRVKNPQGVIVVSSDRAVQRAALQAQIRSLDARDFAAQLLSPPGGGAPDEGSQADIRLTPDEIDDWLTLFNQRDP